MNISEFVEAYHTLSAQEQREGVTNIINQNQAQLVFQFTKTEHARSALRILADAGDRLDAFTKANIDGLLSLLRGEDPKVRMLAVQVIGNNLASENIDALIDAIMHEQTMFTLPSYLLAIGNAKNEKAKRFLESYILRSDIPKHMEEEKMALSKALSNFVVRSKASVRITAKDIILLRAPNTNVTYAQCTKHGYSPKKFGKYIALSGLNNFYQIYKMRAFTDAYIYIGKCPVAELQAFFAKREDAIIQRTNVAGYRLEVRGVSHEERVDLIKHCVSGISKMVNTPSSYSLEILIEIENDEAYVMLNPLSDPRFSYRKRSIAASIHPGVAASVCAYASEYFNPDARVLDSFCGSGTMLFERGIYAHHTLTGTDIDTRAIEAAQENSRFADVHPQFHRIDTLKFTAKKYDEIITNMPFGLRVGSHAQNEKLYRAYFAILPQLVTRGGTVVLYTHEKSLTEKLLGSIQNHFELRKRATFDAGGLFPAVYILKRK